jgi:acetoin utilization protein AcuB
MPRGEGLGMTKPIPMIQRYMSTAPVTVEPTSTIVEAHELLRTHRIRHLPVVTDGRLVGLLSDRDVALVEALAGVNVEEVTVSDAMSKPVYTVAPDALLDDVCLHMAEHKLGSAVVEQNRKVVGVFTAVDGLRALGELLRTRLAK